MIVAHRLVLKKNHFFLQNSQDPLSFNLVRTVYPTSEPTSKLDLIWFDSMASISNEPEREHRDDEESGANEDEDTGAQVAPIVRLEEVAVTTGEEDEDTILDLYVYPSSIYILIVWSYFTGSDRFR